VLLDQDLRPSAQETGQFVAHDVPFLSQGAADQLYLAVRLAVCQLTAPDAPILLDDALATFDDGRMALALALLKGLEKSVTLPAGGEAKALRRALISQLSTAYSAGAVLLTNQNGYAEMDGWEDKNGRSLLVPNPADPQVYRLGGRRVVYGDNDLIPDEEEKAPIYVGKFQAVGTLFVRQGIEVAATDVGGDA